MAPNLFLLYKKAVTPWTWYTPNKSKTRKARKLFVSNEPVPGLYALTSRKKRYLVALKSNGRKDKEHIFKSNPSSKDSQVKSTKGSRSNETSAPNSKKDGNMEPLPLDPTKEGNNSSDKTIASNTDGSVTKVTSNKSISSTQAVKSAIFIIGGDTTSNTTQTENSPTLSTQETLCVSSQQEDLPPPILENHGVLPHQSQLLGQNSRKTSTTSLTSLGSNIYKYDIHGIEKVHLDDYRFLRHPLRIEYCTILQRWMFASEIQHRTVITPMCRNLNCMEKDMTICGKTVDMQLFCLDDAESWVVVGKGNGGRVGKRWEQHLVENGRLYCVDENTKCVRRQSVEEVKASRVRLARNRARFAVFDQGASYMPVVRYLEEME